MKALQVSLLILFVLALPLAVAHRSGGQDKVVGDYLVDFGYDPKEPMEKTESTLSFILTKGETPISADVKLIIKDGAETLFSGTLPHYNRLMTFTFPHDGPYVIQTLFIEDAKDVVQTEFILNVAKGPWFRPIYLVPPLGLVLLWLLFSSSYEVVRKK